MIGWLFAGPCLLAPLGLFLGEVGSTQNFVILGIGLSVMVAGFVAGPLYLRSYNRGRTAQLLGREIDSQLRNLAGIKSWGLTSEVLINHSIPAGEPWTGIEVAPGSEDQQGADSSNLW